jgi:hypothetical protein
MLFSIHRDPEKTPELPGIGDFYGSFLADLRHLFGIVEPKQERGSIRKTQTWQQQKEILLAHAYRAAAEQEAIRQKAQGRKRVRKRS